MLLLLRIMSGLLAPGIGVDAMGKDSGNETP